MTQKTLYSLLAVLVLLLGVSVPLQAAETTITDSNESTKGRAFVFLFDDPGPSARFQAERRDAARTVRQWLRTNAEPSDRVAVATFLRGLRPHHDLAEVAEARESLEDAVNTAVRRAEATWTPPASPSEADDVSFFAKLPPGDTLVDKTSTLDAALVAIGDAARAINERIELVYLGPGFGEITALGDFIPDLRPRPEVIESLREGGVAFHALDLRVPLDLEPFPTLLDDLASETGGSYIFAFESYPAMLLEIERRVRGE